MKFLFALTFLLSFSIVEGQTDTEAAARKIFFGPAVGSHLPAQDLANRYGICYSIGPTLGYKLSNNLQFGLSYSFLYGRKTKIYGLFGDLMTDEGYIINNAGIPANVITGMRGHALQLTVGKVFPIFDINPNTGILLNGGIGFLSHKVGMDHREDEITLLEGEYKKGYDRLATGMMLSGLLAYQHFSKSGRVNFFAGVEYRLGLTQGMRSYNYDTKDSDLGVKRYDGLIGIRAGWYVLIDRW